MQSTLQNKTTKFARKKRNLTHVWDQDYIDPHLVIRFPQVRKTFDQLLIQELADDIAQKNMIQPPIIAQLDQACFKKYVDVFEKISKTKIDQTEYPREIFHSNTAYYYVLIAGERRYRANMLLWESGCTKCKEEAERESRKLAAGECFKKHFPDGLMECRIGQNVDPKEAKSVQFRENNHVKPPINEEAYAYRDHFDYLKTLNPKLTLKEFSVEVGVTVEKVRKAIWFCELPEMIRTAVEKKFVSYSNALELKRIIEIDPKAVGITKEKKQNLLEAECWWLIVNPKIKHDDYKLRITNIITELGMPTLFDMQPFQMTKKDRRAIVGKNYLQHIGVLNGYVAKIEQVSNQGVLGKGKAYSGISPTKQLRDLAEKLKVFIPGFGFTEEQYALIKKFSLEK